MNYYHETLPYAWITSNKNRLKVYENENLYLTDRMPFEIEFYNPTTYSYLAKIYINDKLMSPYGLVIKPGQRAYLERYLENDRGFVFETYQIEDTKYSKQILASNGAIRIEFYKERVTFFQTNWIANIYPTKHWFEYDGTGKRFDEYKVCDNPLLFRGTGTGTKYTSHTLGNKQGMGEYIPMGCHGEAGSTGAAGVDWNAPKSLALDYSPKSIETGRVEQGIATGQQLRECTGDFENYYSVKVEYKLKPESTKPVYMGSVKKYCSCGTKIKESNNFCPTCGKKCKCDDKFCINCGERLEILAKFCSNCGTRQ